MPGQHGLPGPQGEVSNTCAKLPGLVLLFVPTSPYGALA